MRPSAEPTEKHKDTERGCVTLFFDDTDDSADFYLRGAICWPIDWPNGSQMDVSGYAMVAGQDIQTKEITVFQERSFVTVSNILGADNRIEFPGLETFFNQAWGRYYLSDYFWHGNEVTTKQWRLETIRNELIKPKPYFIHVDWSEDEQAVMQAWQAIKTKRVNVTPIGAQSMLMQQIERIKAGEGVNLPAVRAFMALIAGLNRYPYRG